MTVHSGGFYIDIRDVNSITPNTTIIQFDDDDGMCNATEVTKFDCNTLTISDSDQFLLLRSKQSVQNLIKALEKAIELEWVK